ncbi:Thiamin diphosphate-binding protein [Auricularia subglabra TFB-10046 SS5]|nr:Thiamin diphosphate-binding protein [Auricularia subglabra TFB-10046 SS5]
MLSTSSAFIKALTDAGITHAFVNWGSDHPALLEELARLASTPDAPKFQIVTCPHESVALSAAQGYAQASGRPAAVLVHVDVGTQSLAGAVHNCARGRAPVLIYAGAAPFSTEGEFRGSRNEFIFWLQDAVDQPAIVRQYMKHTAEIYSGKNVGMVVRRALQFATSAPQGPVYLWARREIMEEEIDEETYSKSQVSRVWPSIQPAPIVDEDIVEALAAAHAPLIITSYVGRQPEAVGLLAELCDLLAVFVVAACPTAPVLPPGHIAFAGPTYGRPPPAPQPNPLDLIYDADVILILDADIPFAGGRTPASARIFHIDVDPLKDGVGTFNASAEIVCRADTLLALRQLVDKAGNLEPGAVSSFEARRARMREWHEQRQNALRSLSVGPDEHLTVPAICHALAAAIPNVNRTLILNEGVSNYPAVWEHLGESGARMITSGGSSLGWGLGAAIGARLSSTSEEIDLVVLIAGDGSFLFGVPAAAYWIAQNYDAPFLTVVLNNGGWRSPKLSMLGVHPSGYGAAASTGAATLGVSFGPNPPDYSGIAVAAGNAWGKRVQSLSELDGAIRASIAAVLTERRTAVLDCIIDSL